MLIFRNIILVFFVFMSICMILFHLDKNESFPVPFLSNFTYTPTASSSTSSTTTSKTAYKIGTGIADVTGSAAEIGMMGYAMLNQKTNGLHIRLRSRAFIFHHKASNHTAVFVNVDICMIQPTIKNLVIERLKQEYGDAYDHDNVLLSATHTHAGPGGYSQLVLYDMTTLGYSERNQMIIVDGIVKSIARAHATIQDGRIKINTGKLDDANINRSPFSYEANSKDEKSRYSFNTDHLFTLLKFEDTTGTPIGMLNWFSVHGTSMNNSNGLISGDNKGRASQLFENFMNSESIEEDQQSIVSRKKKPFVAAFGQTNEGDVSPNTNGPTCPDGSTCDSATSLCEGQPGFCVAKGPGDTDIESANIIGHRQYEKAKELWDGATTEINGDIKTAFTWKQMHDKKIIAKFTSTGKDETTCTAALGFGFAGGTTDGPGDFPFHQGDLTGNKFFDFVKNFLSKPTDEQIECQHPKPILLNTGSSMFPVRGHAWTANVLPLQIIQIGDLIIIGAPGEFTTMAGRRLRQTVYDTLKAKGMTSEDTVVVIAGLANSYSHYITTYDEFQVQRYEGASTLFGPNTLAFYQQEFATLTEAIANDNISNIKSDEMEDYSSMRLHFRPGVIVDSTPMGIDFGDVFESPNKYYLPGDTVKVVFYGAHPNNHISHKSYLTVERKTNTSWEVVADDSAWETIYRWARHKISESLITVEWKIPETMVSGTYRIRHFGYHKNILQKIRAYTGTSAGFELKPPRVNESSTSSSSDVAQSEGNESAYYSTLVKRETTFNLKGTN